MSLDKVNFKTKLSYGMGEIPVVLTKQVTAMFFMFFLTDAVGISPIWAGTVFMIGRAWDAITDPLVGILSDRTRTKWGRRRPFIIFMSIPLPISFILMFHSFPIENKLLLTVIYTLFYVLFMTIITVYFVPYVSLLPDLTQRYNERQSIVNYRIFFSLTFGFIGSVVPKIIIDSFEDIKMGFTSMSLIIAVFIAWIPFVTFFNTEEKDYSNKPVGKFKGISEFTTAFKNETFVLLMLIYLGSYAAINLVEGFVIYYMKYWIHREEDMPILFISVIIFGVISLPIWSKVSKKIGKKNTIIIGLSYWIPVNLLWMFIGPTTNSILLYGIGALVGIAYGCAQSLPWAMLPEVIDFEEYQTGQRREGVYAGIMTFCMKMANSLSMYLIGLLLTSTGYVANQPQTLHALQTIRYTMALGPILFLTPGLIAALKFPLTKEKYDESLKNNVNEGVL